MTASTLTPSVMTRSAAEECASLSSRGAFSIVEWCRYRGICPATFYNRRRFGEMPAVLKIGRRTLITAEADAEWRRRMEAADASEAAPKSARR